MATEYQVKGLLNYKEYPNGLKKITASLSGTIHQSGQYWISECPILDIMAMGKTIQEALANTKDVIFMFFESCITHGTLDNALKNLGWIPEQDLSPTILEKILPTGVMPQAFTIEDPSFKDEKWNSSVSWDIAA